MDEKLPVMKMKVTTNSPRRSHFKELVQSGKVQVPTVVTPSSRSSSLKRVKNLPPYAKRISPHALDPTLYGTTTSTGQYRSPSRILFESGYLSLNRHRHHLPQDGSNPNHIYENLYNSPSSVSHKSPDQVDGAEQQSQHSPEMISTKMYRNNLRDSVQLKSTSCPECVTSNEGSCPRHRPPEIPPNHPRHPHVYHHSRNHSQHHIRVSPDDESQKTDSLSSGCSTVQSNLYGKTQQQPQQQSNGVKSPQQLNHHVITMKDQKGSSSSRSSSLQRHKSKTGTRDGRIKKTGSSGKKHKKQKKRKEWFFESDPQRRFQFLQSTLIICNVIGIFCGVTGLIVAGFVDPRPIYKLHTFGGQLCLVSVFMIASSLIGLYGARRESCTLLVTYGLMVLTGLFFRSVVYFIASLVTPSSAVSIAISMVFALLEVILILFAFGLAAEVRIKKKNQPAESEITKSSSCSPSPAPVATV